MIDRIKQFIESQGISISAFEQKIGASDGMIRRAIKNKTDIQSKWLVLMSDNYPDLNTEWLITGTGDMIKKQTTKGNSNISSVMGDGNKNINMSVGSKHYEDKEGLKTHTVNKLADAENEIKELQMQLKIKDIEINNLKERLTDKERLVQVLLDKSK